MEEEVHDDFYSQSKRIPAVEDNISMPKLAKSIEELNASVNRLYALFESVKKEMLDDYEKGRDPEEELHQKINGLHEQNRHIAESIIALSEKIEGTSHSEKMNLQLNKSNDEMGFPERNDIPRPQRIQSTFPQQQRFDLGANSPNPPFPQDREPEVAFNRGNDSRGAYPQQFIKSNYPSVDDFPGMPGRVPEYDKEIHVEPAKPKKKFLGVF